MNEKHKTSTSSPYFTVSHGNRKSLRSVVDGDHLQLTLRLRIDVSQNHVDIH